MVTVAQPFGSLREQLVANDGTAFPTKPGPAGLQQSHDGQAARVIAVAVTQFGVGVEVPAAVKVIAVVTAQHLMSVVEMFFETASLRLGKQLLPAQRQG